MWERPIRIGDFLEVENTKGVVEEINTRSTRIRRVDGVHLLIPTVNYLRIPWLTGHSLTESCVPQLP